VRQPSFLPLRQQKAVLVGQPSFFYLSKLSRTSKVKEVPASFFHYLRAREENYHFFVKSLADLKKM